MSVNDSRICHGIGVENRTADTDEEAEGVTKKVKIQRPPKHPSNINSGSKIQCALSHKWRTAGSKVSQSRSTIVTTIHPSVHPEVRLSAHALTHGDTNYYKTPSPHCRPSSCSCPFACASPSINFPFSAALSLSSETRSNVAHLGGFKKALSEESTRARLRQAAKIRRGGTEGKRKQLPT